MITEYNKFNIDEKSIYTEKDIDEVLDKGAKNWDTSDYAILMSYATDDKEIKELIKKIKSYKEPFSELNLLISGESDKEKKMNLMRRWLKLSEELGEIEHELRYKFRIEDPKKLANLSESLSFAPNYEYNSITILINNIDEIKIVGDIVVDFCRRNNIEGDMIAEFFRHIGTMIFTDLIYVRLTTNNYRSVLVAKWGDMIRLKDNDISGGVTYEKVLTVKDLQNGVLNNLMRHNKLFPAPSYSPKKIIKESAYYTNNEDLPTDHPPLYVIGDVVKLKDDSEDIQRNVTNGLWIFIPPQRRFIGENMGKPLKIVQKYITGSDLNDETFRNKWCSAFDCPYSDNNIVWFRDECLQPIEVRPTYRPRRMDRTMESVEKSISDTYKKKLSYSKYNPIVVRIQNEEDKKYFFDLVGWYGVFPDYDLNDYPIETDYVITLKDLSNMGLKPFKIGFTDDYSYYESGDMELYNPDIYPKLLTPGDLYYVLKELLGIPNAKAMYSPKKMIHSIDEANEWYPYRIKTQSELEEEFGLSWRREVFGDVGWNPIMIRILGIDFKEKYFDIGYYEPEDEIRIEDEDGEDWAIPVMALTKNKPKLVPSYKPRKMERTLETTDFEKSLIRKIQSVLTKDLLIPEWSKKLETGKHHPHAGHCYAASEALYHLLGGKEKGYKPMRGKLNGETHWWIQDKNGNILDPTSEQFYFVGLKPPYENGKGTGFLTKNPSKRAKEIISRIQNI